MRLPESYTILIIHYDKVGCTLLPSILTGRMFRIHTIQAAGEILREIEDRQPDLVVVDMGLHETQMSAWELVRNVRQRFGLSLLIFLLIGSGHGYQYLEAEYQRLYDYIYIVTIPADVVEIWQGVKKLMGVYPWGEDWNDQAAKLHQEKLRPTSQH